MQELRGYGFQTIEPRDTVQALDKAGVELLVDRD